MGAVQICTVSEEYRMEVSIFKRFTGCFREAKSTTNLMNITNHITHP